MANSASNQKKVYFHVGLERTGTTFLQRKVFPYLIGTHFIPKKDFANAPSIIARGEYDSYLVSHEFNRGFDDSVKAFYESVEADIYPILVLRRHDQWLLSLYKRILKNGNFITLETFAKSQLNPDALSFYNKILLLQSLGNSPLVLSYDDLVNHQAGFIQIICDHTGTKCPIDTTKLKPTHRSYSEHQLQLFYHIAINGFKTVLQNRLLRYIFLHLANIMPSSKSGEARLFTSQYLDEIRRDNENDWQKCLESMNRIK